MTVPDVDNAEDLKRLVEQGAAVEQMVASEGWQILSAHQDEQLEAYKADMMLNCKSWDDYQEKRGKVFGIQLLRVTVDDFIRMGHEAASQLKSPKT